MKAHPYTLGDDGRMLHVAVYDPGALVPIYNKQQLPIHYTNEGFFLQMCPSCP